MNVIETAQALVRIPSVNPGYDPRSPGEAEMTNWLADWAQRHGFECQVTEVLPGRSNVIFRLRNGADRPHLLLNGHTDTVAVAEMSVPPFGAELRNERLWGRGAADMKGPLACMMHALIGLREDTSRWRGTVTLACVVDEEVDFAGIRHFLKAGTKYDCAVVGEPTCFEVVRGCKGCLRFSVRAYGQAAHSSAPEKGASAISAMALTIAALDRYFADTLGLARDADLGCSTGSVGLIQGGSGVNIVPDFCEIKVDIRLIPGQQWEETYAELRRVSAVRLPRIRWEFDSAPLVDFPFCLDENHDLVRRALSASSRRASRVVPFSCDASKIAAAGIPCIIFGPGDIAQAHTADESIALDELERGVMAYRQIAEALLPR